MKIEIYRQTPLLRRSCCQFPRINARRSRSRKNQIPVTLLPLQDKMAHAGNKFKNATDLLFS
jgi:hypothetical protein